MFRTVILILVSFSAVAGQEINQRMNLFGHLLVFKQTIDEKTGNNVFNKDYKTHMKNEDVNYVFNYWNDKAVKEIDCFVKKNQESNLCYPLIKMKSDFLNYFNKQLNKDQKLRIAIESLKCVCDFLTMEYF